MERGLLKQRIVGGVVLVAVAVIVVPYVLDFGNDREWWGQGAGVPEPPEQGFVTRVLPLEKWARQAESELAAGTARIDAPLSPPPAPDAPAAPALSPPAPPPTVSAPAAQPADKSADKQEWVVQLGSFSSKKNADDLSGFLVKRGFRAFVERNIQSGDAVYRVRIGPETARARADTLRERVERETQLRAIVLQYP